MKVLTDKELEKVVGGGHADPMFICQYCGKNFKYPSDNTEIARLVYEDYVMHRSKCREEMSKAE